MQIVIELNDNEYAELNELKEDHPGALSWSAKRILDGTPLPRGHGRLIDADAVYDDFEKGEYDFEESLEFAPTIIPADNESEDNG